MARLPNPAVKSHARFRRDLGDQIAAHFPKELPHGVTLDCRNVEVGRPHLDEDCCRMWVKTRSAPITADLAVSLEDDSGELVRASSGRMHIGDVPEMDPDGSFLVNGTPTIILPMLERSPGLLREFDPESQEWEIKAVPEAGPWLSVIRRKDDPVAYARLNKGTPVPASTLLRALGMDDEGMLDLAESIHGTRRFRLGKRREGGLVLQERRRSGKWDKRRPSEIDGLVLARDVLGIPAGSMLAPEELRDMGRLLERGQAVALDFVGGSATVSMIDTLAADDAKDAKDAKRALAASLVPRGTEPTEAAFDAGIAEFAQSDAGRRHILEKTGADAGAEIDLALAELLLRDLIALDSSSRPDNTYSLENRRAKSVGGLLSEALDEGVGYWIKDAERLVRQTHRESTRPGRKSKAVDGKPKSLAELDPEHLAMPRYITGAMRRLLNGRFADKMDNTNPLSELMHRRRIITDAGQATGGMGNVPESARWVGDSHFRRLSASESPEGKNIGLANYASLFAQHDRHGFLSTPARRIKGGSDTGATDWLSPHSERRSVLALDGLAADGSVRALGPSEDGSPTVLVRVHDADAAGYVTRHVRPDEVTHATISSDDSLAPAAALVPFAEHNDGTRMAMASAHARQAVPCIRNERPLVSTGRERVVAEAAGAKAIVLAGTSGDAVRVDGTQVVVKGDGPGTGVEWAALSGSARPSHGPFPRLRPAVREGDRVEKGDALAYGEAVRSGGLALGRNVKVAYMPWRGLNFEDSIVISERLVREDALTSLHVRQFSCRAGTTLLGDEEITADLPDVGASELVRLDDDGIIRIGSIVKERDVLVGKVRPKEPNEEETAEEKLLRMVFNRNYGKVKDASLRMPPGYDGAVVVDVRSMTIRGGEGELEPTEREAADIRDRRAKWSAKVSEAREWTRDRLLKLAAGRTVASAPGLAPGQRITKRWLSALPMKRWPRVRLADADLDAEFRGILRALAELRDDARHSMEALKAGPEDIAGGSGTLRRVVVTVAYKRRIQVGDKLSGRHGNKGVISRIVPIEDMPFDPRTGEPVDIVLNPLGVPSRMNIGQIMEVHLGLAVGTIAERLERIRRLPEERRARSEKALHDMAKSVGWRGMDLSSPRALSDDAAENGLTIESPAFDGVREADIKRLLRFAGLPASGQIRLRDGITGELLDRPVTVGWSYIYKLHHMIEDKMHARHRGRYVPRTQQPVQGRSRHGGQRLGEMEVWALEAYGAAFNLLEMTTIKSDDEEGRMAVDAAIMMPRGSERTAHLVDEETGKPVLGKVVPGYIGQLAAFDSTLYNLRALGLDMYEVGPDGEAARAEPDGDASLDDRVREEMERADAGEEAPRPRPTARESHLDEQLRREFAKLDAESAE